MLNSKLRFSGLSSGLDTDTMIKQLMQIEKAKVEKVQKDRTMLEWKRDEYRSITNSIRSFKDEFFDMIKPSTNFRSDTAFASYNAISSNEAIATVKASVGAAATVHTLNVKNLATSATIKSDTEITSLVNASAAVSDFNLQGKQISVTLDGVKKTIDLENYSDIGDLQIKLQDSIDNAFGKVNATTSKINVLVNVVFYLAWATQQQII
jgi:flagellar hook-associated protein 2